MEAINNIKALKNYWNVHSEWEKSQKKNEYCYNLLKNKTDISDFERTYADKKGKVIVEAVRKMDQISINKSENAMLAIKSLTSLALTAFVILGAQAGYLLSILGRSKNKAPKTGALIGYILSSLISVPVSNFLLAHFEKQSTRVARFQTKNNEMKDIRNFVVYTDEQIEQAKEIAKNLPDEKDVTEDMSIKQSLNPLIAYKKSVEDISSLQKDYKDYKKWQISYLENEEKKNKKLKEINLSNEEQVVAEKDKNLILDTVKKLEIGSNNYEIDFSLGVRLLALLLGMSTTIGGFLGFWALGKLAKKTADKPVLSKIINSCSKLAFPAGIATMFLVAGPMAKLSKDSAKIGRHKESKKLTENKNFIPYQDKQLNDIKKQCNVNFENSSWTQKFKEDIKNLFGVKKDFVEYSNYKNSVLKEELKLQKALKHVSISKDQEEQAKKLQKDFFMTFEKIDDKTESFVDDTVALTGFSSQLINGTVCGLANLAILKMFGNKISKLTNNKTMPGFFEGLKLSKNLSAKDLGLIFILPFVATRSIVFLTSLFSAEIQKKACQIGMMEAINELDNPKYFAKKQEQTKQQLQQASPNKHKTNIKNVFSTFTKIQNTN